MASIGMISRSLRSAIMPLLAAAKPTPDRPPYLVHAPSLLQPCNDVPGEMHTSIASLGSKLGLHTDRWGINLESLSHGTRSSIPHAHSSRDEFIYVVSGSGLVWLDGVTYEVGPGDCVGFPAGTGEAHAFIKDGAPDAGWADDYEERVKGGPLVLLVIGENGRSDRVWYPRGAHEHPSKMRQRSGWWADPPHRPQGSHSGWPFKPRPPTDVKFGPPSSTEPPPAAFWPTTGRVLHAKVMPAPCPFVPGGASAMLSSFTGLSGRFDVTQLRLPPGLASHHAPIASISRVPVAGPPPDAVARAKGDTLVYVLEGSGELDVWNAQETLKARSTGQAIKTETSTIEEGHCAVFPGGSGLAWSVRNTAPEGSKEDLDILIVEENIPGDSVVYPCANDIAEGRARAAKEGWRWWNVEPTGGNH